jgi:penicillin-binding protein 2
VQSALKIPRYKTLCLFFGIIVAIAIIFSRLAYLQIHLREQLHVQSKKNFLRLEVVKSPRGNIVDVHGNLLATNRPVHNLYWCGSGKHVVTAQYQELLEKIELIIEQPLLSKREFLQDLQHVERHQKKLLMVSDLSFDKLCQLEELFPECTTLCIETEFQRYYPHGQCASHILGYLGNINADPQGRMGIEHLCEATLRGKSGIQQKTINSLGRSLMEQMLEEALAGDDIQATIDLAIQNMIENIFPEQSSGTCIIMKPRDGSIVALVSRPHFNPNTFLAPLAKADWQAMQEGNLFLNRALSACYPPGSIFKLVTTSAALEEGIITPETCWFCHGYITVSDRKYRCQCHKKWGHAELTAKQALSRSCNTFFYEIGKKIPIDTLANYAFRFGLGQKTSTGLPQKSGLVPTSRWKLQTKGEQWWPGETIQATIGQSFLLVTPIQIARMIAGIFTGYLVNPRIVVNEPVVCQPLEIAKSTREFLQDSMKLVATEGTGQRIGKIVDLEIFAKTSTAQTSGLEKRDLGLSYLEHGWFVAYFKYKDYEPLVLILLIENAGTARIPMSVAKRFLVEYKRFMDTC